MSKKMIAGEVTSELEDLLKSSKIIRSKRKTLAIQIDDNGRLVIRAPLRYPEKEMYSFISKHTSWILSHAEKIKLANDKLGELEPFSAQDIRDMAQRASEIIPLRVRFYAEKLGVTYGRITIRNQRSKWGSCTSKGNLNFNCLLMAAPPEVLDSIVVHELCHRIHMDHSKQFYNEVYKVFPEYDKCNKWLKENGSLLIKRMISGKEKTN